MTKPIDYLIVAGGGGAGAGNGGGGGAGGVIYKTAQNVTTGTFTVTVGAGGASGGTGGHGSNGSNSSFNSDTSIGGGGGSYNGGTTGNSGGSGGGGASAGGAGTSGQGFAGGTGNGYAGAGGGGGASEAGDTDGNGYGGDGIADASVGNFLTDTTSGVSGYIAGGGLGRPSTGAAGLGGGGGFNTAGTANTGSGGGSWDGTGGQTSGAGGSGLVIVKLLTADWTTITGGTQITSGSYTYCKFTSSSSLVLTEAASIDGTLNQDTYITGYEPTTNKNGIALLIGDNGGGDKARVLLKFTLPANPGSATITDIKVSLYHTALNGGGSYSINAYNGTSTPATTWVDSQATWNIYKTSTNWTASGAFSDFISTIVGSYSRTVSSPTSAYLDIPIQGTGATNPLSLNWGDTVNLLIAAPSSAGNNDSFDSSSQTNPPKITISYTASATNSNMLMH